jgi:hypothetical protein
MKNLQYTFPNVHIRGGIKNNVMKQLALNTVSKANSLRIPNWKSILFNSLKTAVPRRYHRTEITYLKNTEANVKTYWRHKRLYFIYKPLHCIRNIHCTRSIRILSFHSESVQKLIVFWVMLPYGSGECCPRCRTGPISFNFSWTWDTSCLYNPNKFSRCPFRQYRRRQYIHSKLRRTSLFSTKPKSK